MFPFRLLSLAITLSLGVSAHVNAQSPAPAIPSLVPPGRAKWTITFNYGANVPAADPAAFKPRKPVKIDYEVDDQMGMAETTFAEGPTEKRYLFKRVMMSERPQPAARGSRGKKNPRPTGVMFIERLGGDVRAEGLNEFSDPFMRFIERFPGFEWINASVLKEVVDKDGKKYLHFFQKATGPDPTAKAHPLDVLPNNPAYSTEDREAWINADTGLPVMFRHGAVTATYLFGEPSGKLELPPAFEKAWRFYQGLE